MGEPALEARPLCRLYPLDEAAALIGIPPVRLARWALREGRIAYVQPTQKTVLFRQDDLEDFIAAHSHPATREPSPTLNKPKSAAHRKAISEAMKASHARRKAAG